MRTDFTVMPWLAKKMRARSAGVHAVRVVAGWVGAQLARIMPTDTRWTEVGVKSQCQTIS